MAGTFFLNKAATLASIALTLLCAAEIARAQADRHALELQWSAPPACPGAIAARSAISALIRDQPEAGEHARARVLIEGSNQRGYVARIDITRGESTGERELRGGSCDSVADAAVLIIAMAIDPEGASARAAAKRQSAARAASSNETRAAGSAKPAPEPTSSPPRTAEREAKPEQTPEPEASAKPDESVEQEEDDDDEPPSDPRRAGRIVLGLHGTGDAGSLPRATIGGGLLSGLHWQYLRLELYALAYVPQVAERSPAPGSTDISLYTGTISGCIDALGARDEPRAIGACASVEAGLSRGAPGSISDGRANTALWLASFLGVDVRQQLAGPLHARLRVEAGLPVLRPSYEIEPFGRVFHASPVLGRFAISAFVLFP